MRDEKANCSSFFHRDVSFYPLSVPDHSSTAASAACGRRTERRKEVGRTDDRTTGFSLRLPAVLRRHRERDRGSLEESASASAEEENKRRFSYKKECWPQNTHAGVLRSLVYPLWNTCNRRRCKAGRSFARVTRTTTIPFVVISPLFHSFSKRRILKSMLHSSFTYIFFSFLRCVRTLFPSVPRAV